jgi:hypothetical protein
VGEAGIGSVAYDRRPHVVEMGGAAARIDVQAVRGVVDRDDLGAGGLQRERRNA